MKDGAEGVLAELLLSYPDAVRVHVYKLFEIPVAASVCVCVSVTPCSHSTCAMGVCCTVPTWR